jgi:hypothetical protein
MRMIDKNRLVAMNEIKVRGKSVALLGEEYERVYKDNSYSNQDKMDILDDLWKLITEHNIRLTEILRENGR